MVYGSVQRFDGQVSVFNRTPTSTNYRDLLPEPPPPGRCSVLRGWWGDGRDAWG